MTDHMTFTRKTPGEMREMTDVELRDYSEALRAFRWALLVDGDAANTIRSENELAAIRKAFHGGTHAEN